MISSSEQKASWIMEGALLIERSIASPCFGQPNAKVSGAGRGLGEAPPRRQTRLK